MEAPSLTLDLVLVAPALAFLVSAVGLRGRAGLPPGPDYRRDWSIGGVLISGGILLIVLRGRAPEILSVLGGNMLLIAGHAFLAHGSQYWGRRGTRWPAVLGSVSGLAFLGAWVAGAEVEIRIVVVSMALGAFYLLMSLHFGTLWRDGTKTPAVAAAIVVLRLFVVIGVARVTTAAGLLPDLAPTGPMSTLVLVIGVSGCVGIATVLTWLEWQTARSGNPAAGQQADGVSIVDAATGASETAPGWRLVRDRWALVTPEGVELKLTGSEYLVLQELSGATGAPVARETLNELIGRSPENPKDRGVDILISRLRRKCLELGSRLPITSVRGRGYVFHSELTRAES